MKQKEKRFKYNNKGEIIVTVKLNPSKCSTKKKRNRWLILDMLRERKVMPIKMREAGFNIIDLYFDSVITANTCLDIESRIPRDEQSVWFEIMERNKSRKGVITDWDMSLKKFSEALCKDSNIKTAEKMHKRIYSSEKKNYIWKETNNIIITVEGSTLSEEIKLYDGLATMKVRPYIPAVKQCFNCYRFGHTKAFCRKQNKLCVICGDIAHGHCDKKYNCINCGGNHKANDKRCKTYEYNKNIQEVSAIRNITYYEAKKIIDERQESYENPWIRPERWPEINRRGKKQQTNS